MRLLIPCMRSAALKLVPSRVTPAARSHAEHPLGSCRTLSTNVSINQNGARPNAQPLQHQRSASGTSQSSATLPVAQPPVAAPPQPAPQPPPQSAPQQPPSQQQRTTPPPVPPVHQTPPLQPQQKAHTNGAAVSPEQLATLIQRAGDDGADVQVPGNCVSMAYLYHNGAKQGFCGMQTSHSSTVGGPQSSSARCRPSPARSAGRWTPRPAAAPRRTRCWAPGSGPSWQPSSMRPTCRSACLWCRTWRCLPELAWLESCRKLGDVSHTHVQSCVQPAKVMCQV